MASQRPLWVIFFVFFFFGLGCWYFLGQDQRHRRRLRTRMERIKGEQKQSGESLLPAKAEKFIFAGLCHKFSFLEQLQTLMIQAQVGWRLELFLLLMILGGVAGGLMGFFQWGAAGGLPGAALGLYLPYKGLQLKRKFRLKQFERQLPDALDLMARGLRAGHAVTTGLQLVAVEMPNPIKGEFFKTFKEYNHGLDLNAALNNLCQRIPLRDLSFFTIAVAIQRETGGNLAEILEKISSLIRERFKLRNQIKALTAEGRLSGLILVLLSPATALVLFYRCPEHMGLLVEDPLGRTMAMTALALQFLGILIIRKIVNIKM
jgi:tight adherence protein B